ncbi:trypsin-4-like [Anopheles nili]|uniref:trypsin-4-like n=1 Tax=Anopheles nili TaxID=185578 RepID=UPI00237AEC37|nr:trypsin-4-like [Anopheles nili]
MANRIVAACCLLLFAVAVESANKQKHNFRIVGGFPIDISEAPFQVSLMINGRHACGGSIISPNWVLTAAHCLDNLFSIQIAVRAGSTLKDKGGEVSRVSQIVRHPDWDPDTYGSDYALLELKTPFNLNGVTIASIEMPEQDAEDPAPGSKAMVSGWGATLNKYQSNRVLRATFVPIVQRSDCDAAYGRDVDISERMLCGGFFHGGSDSCQGDSGGPFVVEDLLVGVVSFATGCAKPGYPGVNARVSAVRDWIREVSGI